MAQRVKYSSFKHEDLSSIPVHKLKSQVKISVLKGEAEGSLGLPGQVALLNW